MNTIRDEHLDNLYDAILTLGTRDECHQLFEDLCTISELLSLKQRFWIAQLLDGGMLYDDIVKTTGASTATISRVNRCLHYGKNGYRLTLDRTGRE